VGGARVIFVDLPDTERVELHDVVCDFNGTLALDGTLIDGVRERLAALAQLVTLHVVTADTFGVARAALDGLDLRLTILDSGDHAQLKASYVARCDARRCVAIGNGRNDRDMLATAALGIAVVGPEGAAATTLAAAQVVAPDICAALDLLLKPRRLVATLRR
jgi:soluble P-type ATPase